MNRHTMSTVLLAPFFLFSLVGCGTDSGPAGEDGGDRPLLADERPGFDTMEISYRTAQVIKKTGGAVIMLKEGAEIRSIDFVNNRIRVDNEESFTTGHSVNRQTRAFINNGKRVYQIDPERKEATYYDLDSKGWPVWRESYDAGDSAKKETILGRECRILENETARQWVWQGLVLKQEMIIPGATQEKEAVRIEVNPEFSDKRFEVPPGYRILSTDESMAQTMADLGRSMERLDRLYTGPDGKGLPKTKEGKVDFDASAKVFEKHIEDSRERSAMGHIRAVSIALVQYRLDKGTYPSTAVGLAALLGEADGGVSYLVGDRVPSDPWGEPFVYRFPGVQIPEAFDLFSTGPDGKGDGTGKDDIGNFQLGREVQESKYPDGMLRSRSEYRYGLLDGKSRHYNKDGEMRVEMTYQRGLLHGPMRHYSKDGKPLSVVYYENGKKKETDQ